MSERTMMNTNMYLVQTPLFRIMSSAYSQEITLHSCFRALLRNPCVSPHMYLSGLMSFLHYTILLYIFRLLPFSGRRLINRRTTWCEMKRKKKWGEKGERHKIIWSHLNFFLSMLLNFNMQT